MARKPKPDKPAATTPEQYSLVIPVAKIEKSKDNPRKTFDDLEGLADSIRQQGIIEPLIVRPWPIPGAGPQWWNAEAYQLVCGERRLRAAKLAGLQGVPCVIRNYDDITAARVRVVENNQRKDVHPMEECRGYHLLRKLGDDAAGIAAAIGRSPAYVTARLQLDKLIAPIAKLLEGDKIPLGAAMLVAKLPPDTQKEIPAWTLEKTEQTRDKIRRLLEQHQISEAPWKPDDAQLLPRVGACTTCPKNTANEKLLFADVTSKPTCTDPRCWKAKSDAFVSLRIQKVVDDTGQLPVLLGDRDLKKPGYEVISPWAVSEVKGKRPPKLEKGQRLVTAVHADGEDAGRVTKVIIDGRRGKPTISATEKRRKQQERDQKALAHAVVDNVAAYAGKVSPGQAKVLLVALFDQARWEHQKNLVKLVGVDPGKERFPDLTKLFAAGLAGQDEPILIKLLLEMILRPMADYYPGSERMKLLLRDVPPAFGIDVEALKKTLKE